MTAQLRPATLTDVAAITVLEASFAPKERWSEAAWASEIEADNRRVLVAVGPVGSADPAMSAPDGAGSATSADRAGSGVLGVISVQIVGGVADLNRIVVAPNHRRSGMGADLLAAGIAAADADEADEMLLEVRHDNTAALALYERAGFVEIARRANYYQQRADAVVLRLDLDPELDRDPEGADHV